MAEVRSSSSSDTFSKASTNSTTSVVAPPKFVFGSGMSEKVKQSVDNDSDTCEKEEEQGESGIDFLDYASTAVKRSAHSDDDSPTSPHYSCPGEQGESGIDFLDYASAAVKRPADSDGDSPDYSCPDFTYIPKKMLKTESPEAKAYDVLRPSALSAIANKLASTKQHGDEENNEKVAQDDKSAKTHGESSSSSSSSDSLTSLSRPHLIDTPAPLSTGVQSENYFQQFLVGNSSSSSSESKGTFVFGQNLRERVNVETSSSNDAADVSPKTSKQGDSPKSLAELADERDKTSVESGTEIPHNSIAAAAQKYESEHSPPKQNLAKVHVMTGEEDERNVLQVNCRLFIFCTETHSWLGRGRVILKLNDHCQLNSEGTFHSRLVARTQGSLRLVLNTKLWPEMVIEKASEKAIRVSAMEDGHIQLYLIMAPARENLQLYTAIDRRIETLKREQQSNQKTSDETQESHETTEDISPGKDDDEDNSEVLKEDKLEKERENFDTQSNSQIESEKSTS